MRNFLLCLIFILMCSSAYADSNDWYRALQRHEWEENLQRQSMTLERQFQQQQANREEWARQQMYLNEQRLMRQEQQLEDRLRNQTQFQNWNY